MDRQQPTTTPAQGVVLAVEGRWMSEELAAAFASIIPSVTTPARMDQQQQTAVPGDQRGGGGSADAGGDKEEEEVEYGDEEEKMAAVAGPHSGAKRKRPGVTGEESPQEQMQLPSTSAPMSPSSRTSRKRPHRRRKRAKKFPKGDMECPASHSSSGSRYSGGTSGEDTSGRTTARAW